MTTAPAWALQQAVYAKLVADGVAGGRVFDAVPKNAAFPYAVLGDGEEADNGASTLIHTLTLHLWSRGGGAREIKQLAAAARTSLDGAALALDRQVLIALAFGASDYNRQSDGETWRGALRFRAVTEPQ
jgi:hypothetical protein